MIFYGRRWFLPTQGIGLASSRLPGVSEVLFPAAPDAIHLTPGKGLNGRAFRSSVNPAYLGMGPEKRLGKSQEFIVFVRSYWAEKGP